MMYRGKVISGRNREAAIKRAKKKPLYAVIELGGKKTRMRKDYPQPWWMPGPDYELAVNNLAEALVDGRAVKVKRPGALERADRYAEGANWAVSTRTLNALRDAFLAGVEHGVELGKKKPVKAHGKRPDKRKDSFRNWDREG